MKIDSEESPILPPTVSVVVVNLDGRDLLTGCLSSIKSLDYPPDRVELIVVDNGSVDNSVSYVRENHPSVRVIEAGRNLGFAAANNLGARESRGNYLALINNDGRPDPDWVRAMVDALESQADVACVAAKMLSQDGETVDFVGPAMNLYGRAFQADEGTAVVPGFHDDAYEVLAPCGGAMMIRRDVFLDVGGFDEDYTNYYEDLDLGWRLWLLGYRVLFVPEAVVYHRGQQTGSRFPVEQRYVLSEANALRTVIKNYEEENLWRVLPFSLLMGVKRSLAQGGVDRARYRFDNGAGGDAEAGYSDPEPQMTRVATSYLVAIDQIADEMPRLMEKRRRIQARRARSDDEIFSRFPMRPDNPIFPWRQYHVVQDQLVRALEVPETLRPRHGSRLLVITHETVGPRMAGPGIRAWEIACALSEWFDVTLAAPGEPERDDPRVRVAGFDRSDPTYADLNPYLGSADVVFAMASLFVQIAQLRDLGKPAIVDLYDPFELEKLAQSPSVPDQYHLRIDLDSAVHLGLEGAVGDFYVCASERQRDFWLGALLAAGRVNSLTYGADATLRSLIDVVPFGVPTEPPTKRANVLKGVHPSIGPEDKLLYWNGGLWQWFDPLTLIEAMVEVLQVRDDVKLYFAAGRHFDLETVPEMPVYAQTVERSRELGLLDRHVFFGDWVPYDERGDYLLEADLVVSTHGAGIESRFASRTRLLDGIWAGVPIVATEGDPLSELIAGCGLGRTVAPGRPDLLAETILEMLDDPDLRQQSGEKARPLRETLSWPQVVAPIRSFVERAQFAPDALPASRRAAEARDTLVHIESLRSQIDALEASLAENKLLIASLEQQVDDEATRARERISAATQRMAEEVAQLRTQAGPQAEDAAQKIVRRLIELATREQLAADRIDALERSTAGAADRAAREIALLEERNALQAQVAAAKIGALREEIDSLSGRAHEQGQQVESLEAEKLRLEGVAADLQAHVRAFEEGRVMRLMRAIRVAVGRD